MGGVAVLHPQDCLKDHRDNLNPTRMKSPRTIKFNPNYTNPPSRTPNSTVSDSRRRTPQKNDRNTEAVVADTPAATISRNLAMGQVKILKCGEALNESSTISKCLNDRKVSNGAASTTEKDLVADREVFKASTSGRRVSPTKKKAEKDQNRISNSSPKVEVFKTVSSTDRLQMNKNITELFAGCAFADSPPPSSVPLPGFFTKNLVAAVRDDATADLRRILGLSLT